MTAESNLPALSIRDLRKTYETGVQALKGVSLEVQPGDFYALLGPNGAGKSTLIGIVSSLVNKSSGEVRIFGVDLSVDRSAAMRLIGLVPQEMNFNFFEKPFDILVNYAGFYGMPRAEAVVRAEEELKRAQLWDKAHTMSRTLSGGMKRRLMIARAMMTRPRLLILDEPTSGLDPLMEAVFQDCIREVKAEGRTVLLSSHILAEVEALSDRVSIIRAGRTEQSGTLQELRGMTRTMIIAEVARTDGLAELPGVHALHVEGSRVRFDVDTSHLDAVVRRLSELGVRSLVSQPPTLEELFLRHYGEELANETALVDRLRDRS